MGPHVDDVWLNKYFDTATLLLDAIFLPSPPMVEIKVLKRSRTEATLTQQRFFRKTARGKVIKGELHTSFLFIWLRSDAVLRECYLRDDVSCGIGGCGKCQETELPPMGTKNHSVFPQGHFVIPDTNVFLSQVSGVCLFACFR